MKDRLNVRCCCQPQKILGTLPAPSAEEMRCLRPFLRALRSTESVWDPSRDANLPMTVERVCLPLEKFRDEDGSIELAYKSEETPIERLRRIPGFEETKP